MRATGFLIVCAICFAGCGRPGVKVSSEQIETPASVDGGERYGWQLSDSQLAVLEGAKGQLENPAVYDASYRQLEYPMGDVAEDRGACTDVVIRALRAAGFDLQQLIYEDSADGGYPRIETRDRNIDHRRCPNHVVFFEKYGEVLPLEVVGVGKDSWQPGDLVYWKLASGRDHTGVVSDRVSASGRLMVIHNISGVKEEDVLTTWEVVGHYRYPVVE